MRRMGTSLLIASAATLLAIAPSTIASAKAGTASSGTVRLAGASSTDSEWEGAADLGISKSDTAPGYGPDPVSGGKVVAYRIDVTNDGPDDATNVTVTDTPSAGTVVGASGDGWDCSFTAATATCTLDYLPADGGTDLAAAGSTTELVAATVAATPITVQVKAPASGSLITDTADVWGYEDDPNGENNTATETTTVTPANTPDFQSGFYDGINPLKLSTVFGPGDLMKTTVTIPKPSGPTPYQPGPVVDQEFPASEFPTFCGPKPCDAQVAVLNPIPSGSQPDAPIRLQLIYRGTAKPGNVVYGKGDDDPSAHLLPTCDSPGVARVSGDPAKCVASITFVNGDKKVVTINIADGGDPAAAKR
jgi:uncharacterized repeat protein (TIGR01451 family)